LQTKLLLNETALVTGAATGIGRSIACALAQEGAHVLASDIGSDDESLVAELLAVSARASFVAVDLANKTAADELFEAALRRLGRISILVHSASPRHRAETVFTVAPDAVEHMLAVNVVTSLRLGQLIGTHMRREGIKGKMLFITSLHATTPRTVPHYSAAKAAMTMLMKEFARALGPFGIRVNAIAPGYVAARDFVGADEIARGIPLRRIARPQELAETAVALLSDRFGAYVTGAAIQVDGGLALCNWIPDPDWNEQ
jgi:3-oxoacyl-[acyl-carrier protein] reductase